MVVYLDTGSGKTFVSVLLIRHVYAEFTERAQQRAPFLAVFMAPTVALVEQQFGVLKSQLDLRVSRCACQTTNILPAAASNDTPPPVNVLFFSLYTTLPHVGTLAQSTPTRGMPHAGRKSAKGRM